MRSLICRPLLLWTNSPKDFHCRRIVFHRSSIAAWIKIFTSLSIATGSKRVNGCWKKPPRGRKLYWKSSTRRVSIRNRHSIMFSRNRPGWHRLNICVCKNLDWQRIWYGQPAFIKMIPLEKYNLVYLDDFSRRFHYLNKDFMLIVTVGWKHRVILDVSC